MEMTARFSKNIFIFRLVFTGQKLTVLIFVSKVIRSAKLTLAKNQGRFGAGTSVQFISTTSTLKNKI